MAQRSYPIKGVSRRYWSDADRVTMVANLMATSSLMLHDVGERQGMASIVEEAFVLKQWADEMLSLACSLEKERDT